MSSNGLYIPGEVARISLAVADLAGAAADPGGLILKIKPPTGALISYSYGVGEVIVRDSLGNFHADILLSEAGQWAYRWELSAPNAGAAEGVITVQKSRVI
jgi:uncharacterized protein YfaS (alpha-2-macroglobulin family)